MFIYILYGLKLLMLIFYDNENINTTFMTSWNSVISKSLVKTTYVFCLNFTKFENTFIFHNQFLLLLCKRIIIIK